MHWFANEYYTATKLEKLATVIENIQTSTIVFLKGHCAVYTLLITFGQSKSVLKVKSVIISFSTLYVNDYIYMMIFYQQQMYSYMIHLSKN